MTTSSPLVSSWHLVKLEWELIFHFTSLKCLKRSESFAGLLAIHNGAAAAVDSSRRNSSYFSQYVVVPDGVAYMYYAGNFSQSVSKQEEIDGGFFAPAFNFFKMSAASFQIRKYLVHTFLHTDTQHNKPETTPYAIKH